MEKTSGHSNRRVFVIPDPLSEGEGTNKTNRTMRAIRIIILIAVMLLAGCQKKEEPASSEANKLEEIMDQGVLKVGTTGDYQPMSYLDPDTGEYVGFVDTPHG